jgi:hypothetical protein
MLDLIKYIILTKLDITWIPLPFSAISLLFPPPLRGRREGVLVSIYETPP